MRGAVLRKAVAAASQQTIKGTEEGGGKQGGRRSTRRRKVCLLPLKMDSTSESEWYDVQSVSLEIGICGFDDKKRYSSNSAPNPWKRGRKGGGLHECDLLINGPFDSQATDCPAPLVACPMRRRGGRANAARSGKYSQIFLPFDQSQTAFSYMDSYALSQNPRLILRPW